MVSCCVGLDRSGNMHLLGVKKALATLRLISFRDFNSNFALSVPGPFKRDHPSPQETELYWRKNSSTLPFSAASPKASLCFYANFFLTHHLSKCDDIMSSQNYLDCRCVSTSSPGPSPRSKWRSENPWPRLPKWLQKFLRISSRKHDNVFVSFEQRFPIVAENKQGQKSHFIMCHTINYSMILGVFQQPWPGVSPTTILNEEKALGTRLDVFLNTLHFAVYDWQVIAAARHGYQAHGYELNQWLVWYSRLQTRVQGLQGKATFSRADLWKVRNEKTATYTPQGVKK